MGGRAVFAAIALVLVVLPRLGVGQVKGGPDAATGVATRDTGVYVVGWSRNDSTGIDFQTVKYSSSGTMCWSARYPDTSVTSRTDSATAVVVDSLGRAFVVGNCWNASHTQSWIGLVKYSSQGVRQYVTDSLLTDEKAFAAALDGRGLYLWVVGTKRLGSKPGFLTFRYDSACHRFGVRTCSLPGHDSAIARDVSICDTFVCVTGTSWKGDSSTCLTMVYSDDGFVLDTLRYKAGGKYNRGNAVAAAANGRVYVTGASGVSSGDYLTLFYTLPSTWPRARGYNGPVSGNDEAFDIAVDDSQNVYVTGVSMGWSGHYEFATLKYDSSANRRWVTRRDPGGLGASYGGRACIAAGRGTGKASGHMHVGGSATSQSQGDDMTFATYSSGGESAWTNSYDGPVSGDDRTASIAVDEWGDVYAVGSSDATGSASDFITAKLDGSTGETCWTRRLDGSSGPCWDFGVDSIVYPAGDHSAGDTIRPGAFWANWGTEDDTVSLFAALYSNDTLVYSDSYTLLLDSGYMTLHTFTPVVLHTPGDWSVRCSTYCDSDMVWANDVMARTFKVTGMEEAEPTTTPQGIWLTPSVVTSEAIDIRFALPRFESARVELWDATGRMALRQSLPRSGYGTARLAVSRLAAGVYFLRLVSDGFVATRKVVLRP